VFLCSAPALLNDAELVVESIYVQLSSIVLNANLLKRKLLRDCSFRVHHII